MRCAVVHLAAAALLWAGLAPAGAAPAPWYQWRSLGTGVEVCARASPGSGWTRGDGPFVDAACTRPLRVIRL